MTLTKISKNVMVLEDAPHTIAKNAGIIVAVLLLAALTWLISLDPAASIKRLTSFPQFILSLLFFCTILLLFSFKTNKVILDKSSSKLIIERKSTFSLQKSVFSIKKIAKVEFWRPPESQSFLQLKSQDGSVIASQDINQNGAKQVASFLGVPFEDTYK